MKELEVILHTGTDEFDGFDVHILNVRHQKYMDKWLPYKDWMIARDTYMATREHEWKEAHPKQSGWGEAKKRYLEEWYEIHGKMTKPPENKSGVNLGSWVQIRDGLNDMDIPVKKVNEDALTPYMDHPLVKVYLEYSGARKIVSLYGRERGKKARSFIEMLDELGRLYASYQQLGADTGRMSSFEPNLQQIPDKGLGSELRHFVVAMLGYILVDTDFSNIELRIAAELSGDKFLLDAFASGQDLHAYTAVIMFGLKIPKSADLKEWTESHDAVVGGRTLNNISYRKVAKTINYMLLYGAGVKRLSATLEISEKDARVLLDIYYKTFATVIAWLKVQQTRLDKAKKAGEKLVYSETLSGRRRWFAIPEYPPYPAAKGQQISVEEAQKWEEDVDEYKSQLASIKRQLGNTPIQGLSADITKLAGALWYERVGYSDDMRVVAVIHDEFIVEARIGCEDKAKEIIKDVMYQAMQTYLKAVDLGKVKPVVTAFWKH
jgi:DNA polymerase-1